MSLRRQLLAVLLALSVPVLVVGVVSAFLLRSSTDDHVRTVERVRVGSDISVLQADVAGLTASLTVPELLSSQPAALLGLLRDTGNVERGFAQLRRSGPAAERGVVDQAYREWQELVGVLAVLPARLPLLETDVDALSATLGDLGPRTLRVAHDLAVAAESNARAVEAQLEQTHARQQRELVQLLALALGGLTASVLAARWLHRRISEPLLALQAAAKRLGEGDLADRVPEDRTPELGALGAAFNRMADRLHDGRALLTAREQRFRALVQHSSDLVAVLGAGSVISYVTPSAAGVLGVRDEDLVGTRLLDRVHPEDRQLVAAVLDAAGSTSGAGDACECRLRVDTEGPGTEPATDTWCHAELVVNDLRDEPAVAGLVVTARDVTEQRRLHEQLRHSALHDEVTGLANRALFTDRLDHALRGRAQTPPAVLSCDLASLRPVSDSLGHAAGDALLAAVAARITGTLRARDTPARLGGDEFAVLLDDVTLDEASEAAHRLHAVVNEPVLLAGAEVLPQLSIGLATPRPGENAERLLRQADTAMYEAKHRGAGVVVFDPDLADDLFDRLELTADLQRAMHQGEFLLHYQPTVDLVSGEVTGVEALLRWDHPTRGLVPPVEFIPLAEQSGLIVPLGLWVLETACRQVRAWQLADPLRALHLNVNMSGRQLEQDGIVPDVAGVLAATGYDAGLLTLELTESVLLDRSDEVLQRLHALKALGLRLAIDDFGTGYSSLSYLQRLPVDILKIDKSFVDALVLPGQADALAATIVNLARTLSLETVAEGIEHPSQADALRRLGCDTGQGYLYARPLHPAQLQALLERCSGQDRSDLAAALLAP